MTLFTAGAHKCSAYTINKLENAAEKTIKTGFRLWSDYFQFIKQFQDRERNETKKMWGGRRQGMSKENE